MSHPVASDETDRIPVPESDEVISAARCVLPFDGAGCEILVQADERDEITRAILAGQWTLPAHYELLRALAAPGARVVDLGAHIGTFSLYAAALGYEVVAVEASPRNRALLQASADRNGLAALRVVGSAVGAKPGMARFLQAGPYGFVATSGVQSPTLAVSMTTVDALLYEVGWDDVDFVKMDIEGSEIAALQGMSRLLRASAPPILFESNGHTLNLLGETPARLRAALEANGYRCYELLPARRLAPVGASQLQPRCNVDCLATRPGVDLPAGWELVPPMTPTEILDAAVVSCRDANPHVRAYIARTLQGAPSSLLADPRLRSALDALAFDPVPDVRAAGGRSASRE